jgi:starvation-inducible DNA-binding protein
MHTLAEIGIAVQDSQKVCDHLIKLLADENVVYVKTKNAHWNVEGSDFYEKHKFFESQIDQLDIIIDQVAERIRSIGHYVPATLQSYLSLSQLTERPYTQNDSMSYMKELLSDHESIIITLRGYIKPFANEYGDAGSCDFITGLMEEHEKMAWFLRSHLKIINYA